MPGECVMRLASVAAGGVRREGVQSTLPAGAPENVSDGERQSGLRTSQPASHFVSACRARQGKALVVDLLIQFSRR